MLARAACCALGGLLVAGVAASPAWAVTVPDQPTQIAVATGNGQITVSYAAPVNDGGSAITFYTATCSDDVDPPVSVVSSGGPTATPIAVAPLTTGTSYHCHVTATNGVGEGAASAESASVEVGVPATPAQPVVTRGNGTLSVAFAQPDDSGSPISTDTATCSDGVHSPSVVSQLGSPIVLTASDGLIVNNSYTCQVTATNGVGVSLASPTSAAVTFATVPATPTIPTVTPGNGTLTVTFTQPAPNGSTITTDTATCSDGVDIPSVVSQLGSPIVLTASDGLIVNNSYTCQVTATNGVGVSLASPALGGGHVRHRAGHADDPDGHPGQRHPDRRLHATRLQRQRDHDRYRDVHRRGHPGLGVAARHEHPGHRPRGRPPYQCP